MKSGIYRIRNIFTMKCYIGSSINLTARKTAHFSELRRNKHGNIYLQRSYNLYGANAFVFEIIEYANVNDLLYREIHYINLYKHKYNIQTSNNVNRFVFSDAHKSRLSTLRSQEITICDVKYNSHHEASEKLGVCGRVIAKLKHISSDEQYKYMAKLNSRSDIYNNWINKSFFQCTKCNKIIRANFNPEKKYCNKCGWENGRQSHLLGKKLSKEHIQKGIETRITKGSSCKPISIDGVIYKSSTEASKILKIHKSTICYRLKHKEGYHMVTSIDSPGCES